MADTMTPVQRARSRKRQAGGRANRAPWAAAAFCAVCLVLPLAGCGSEEQSAIDDAPPDHIVKAPESQGKWRYGVEDTLVVEFSEAIDTAEVEVEFSDTSGKAWRFDGRDRLLVYGTKRSFGTTHFAVNTPFTLVLRNLRDDAGNVAETVEEDFQPYAWVDRDSFLDRAFLGFDSLFLDDSTWIDGTSMEDSLVLESALDAKVVVGLADWTDLKLLRLVPPDSLDVILTTRKRGLNIELQVGGPFAEEGLEDSLEAHEFLPGPRTLGKGRIDTTFHADVMTHMDKFGRENAFRPGFYALRPGLIERDSEGFYRLVLKLRKWKN